MFRREKSKTRLENEKREPVQYQLGNQEGSASHSYHYITQPEHERECLKGLAGSRALLLDNTLVDNRVIDSRNKPRAASIAAMKRQKREYGKKRDSFQRTFSVSR